MSKSFRERLYEGLFKPKDRAKGIHVTSLVYECLRKCVYMNTEIQPPHNKKTQIIFKLGDGMHSWNIMDGDYEKTIEYSVDADLKIVGTPDEYKDGFLLEKKTVGFDVSKGNNFKTYYSHYIRQVEAYKILLESIGKPVKEAAIWFVNKEDEHDYLFSTDENSLHLRSSEEIKGELENKARIVVSSLSSKKLPPRNAGKECEFCSYASKCFTSPEGEW